MSPEGFNGKEDQSGVMPSRVMKIARAGSTILKWFKLSAALLLILSFFLPWASQVKGCGDGTILKESISGFSLVVEEKETEAIIAPIMGIIIFVLAFAVLGKSNPLIRSILSLFEAIAVYSSAVFISLGIFFLSFYRERYGFVIAIISLFGLSIASLTEVVVHFPLLKRREKVIVVTVVLLLILFLILSNLPKDG